MMNHHWIPNSTVSSKLKKKKENNQKQQSTVERQFNFVEIEPQRPVDPQAWISSLLSIWYNFVLVLSS